MKEKQEFTKNEMKDIDALLGAVFLAIAFPTIVVMGLGLLYLGIHSPKLLAGMLIIIPLSLWAYAERVHIGIYLLWAHRRRLWRKLRGQNKLEDDQS